MASRHHPRPRARRRFDDELSPYQPDRTSHADETSDLHRPPLLDDDHDDDGDDGEPPLSTYPDATHGPHPVPAWVVTDADARDVDRGVLKTGKEAEVSLVERSTPEQSCLLAAKRYRTREHRLFHRDAGYLEGRRVRRSRETRAMATRTAFGRDLIAGQWASAEFAILGRLWSVGAAVPYPVQLIGTELMLEFIGDPDGTAAPRLAQLRPERTEAHDLYEQLREVLLVVADVGYTHGDLSAYNVLVHDGRLVLIDVPQVVDIVDNPQGFDYLRRDCRNICQWFATHGVPDADGDELADWLSSSIPRG